MLIINGGHFTRKRRFTIDSLITRIALFLLADNKALGEIFPYLVYDEAG